MKLINAQRYTFPLVVHATRRRRRDPSSAERDHSLHAYLRNPCSPESRRQRSLQLNHRPPERCSRPDVCNKHCVYTVAPTLWRASPNSQVVARPLWSSYQFNCAPLPDTDDDHQLLSSFRSGQCSDYELGRCYVLWRHGDLYRQLSYDWQESVRRPCGQDNQGLKHKAAEEATAGQ